MSLRLRPPSIAFAPHKPPHFNSFVLLSATLALPAEITHTIICVSPKWSKIHRWLLQADNWQGFHTISIDEPDSAEQVLATLLVLREQRLHERFRRRWIQQCGKHVVRDLRGWAAPCLIFVSLLLFTRYFLFLLVAVSAYVWVGGLGWQRASLGAIHRLWICNSHLRTASNLICSQ